MANRITILDGGIGHELKRRGVLSSDGTFVAGVLQNEINDSLTNKINVVESIHADYLAHCDVITTNSFVAVPQRMIESGLVSSSAEESYPNSNQRAAQLIIAAVYRAKTAITKHNATFDGEEDDNKNKQKKMIAGCIPPLTECYMSDKVPTTIDLLINEYKVILSTLIIDCQESVCQVDVLLAETLSTTREAQAILRSLAIIRNNTKHRIPPLWISFTVHDDQPTKLRSDESLVLTCQSIIQEAAELHITLRAIGINCSTPSAITESVPILVKLVEGMDIKVIAYGNCFKTTTSEWITGLKNENAVTDGNACTSETRLAEIMDYNTCANDDDYDDKGILTVDAYSRYACEWARLGARIIGGCCGCSPMHMQQVAIASKDF